MSFTPLSISGCWLFMPSRYTDSRGYFQETFKRSALVDATGIDFEVKQVNQSLSAAGVVRGIHWADVPPGQAKYVSVARGEIVDFIIDLRTNSPTFREWQAIPLSAENGNVVVVGNGIGHAFLSLQDDTIVTYLCSEEYSPATERTLNPLDPTIGISFASFAGKLSNQTLSFSAKDESAPSLQELLKSGLLPK